MQVAELKKDAEEFGILLNEAKRRRVKDALIAAKHVVDMEIVNLEIKANVTADRKDPGVNIKPKRYLVELTEYAWDQSDKFVKLFVTLNGVQDLDESNVTVTFTENSVNLLVKNIKDKDYTLVVNNLLNHIDVAKSYRKVKTDIVAIYMKKKVESQNWNHLTTIQKRLKEKQDSELKSETDSGEDALVNIMKKMYNSGDTKTKQMIAKAWTESQEKARNDRSEIEL